MKTVSKMQFQKIAIEKSVEIIKETPSYLKINARFENQGRKSITIYNIYEDYNELIKEIKNIGGKQWS